MDKAWGITENTDASIQEALKQVVANIKGILFILNTWHNDDATIHTFVWPQRPRLEPIHHPKQRRVMI